MLRNHVNPAIGTRTLAQVAGDRDAVRNLLNITLPASGLGASQVRTAYIVVTAVIGDAIEAGKLTTSRLRGIQLPAPTVRAEFVFASHAQLVTLAERLGPRYGALVWLMRGCGLRIGEALAVGPQCIRPGGVLRVSEQLLTTGLYGPLEHRKAGDFRDVPMPAYVAQALAELPAPEGRHYFAGTRRATVAAWFRAGRKLAGLPDDYATRALRHTFASVALANDVPITDVSKWLGHQNINTTYAIYGHLVPSSWDRAKQALDNEYASWKVGSKARTV
jgi:integrase